MFALEFRVQNYFTEVLRDMKNLPGLIWKLQMNIIRDWRNSDWKLGKQRTRKKIKRDVICLNKNTDN